MLCESRYYNMCTLHRLIRSICVAFTCVSVIVIGYLDTTAGQRERRGQRLYVEVTLGLVKPLFLCSSSWLNFEVTVAYNAGNRIGDNVGISVSYPWGPDCCSTSSRQSPDRFRPISRGRCCRRFDGDENYRGRSGLNLERLKTRGTLYHYVQLSRKNIQTGREASMFWQRSSSTVIQLSHCHCDIRLAVVFWLPIFLTFFPRTNHFQLAFTIGCDSVKSIATMFPVYSVNRIFYKTILCIMCLYIVILLTIHKIELGILKSKIQIFIAVCFVNNLREYSIINNYLYTI